MKNHAFTLIELLVVVLIIGILAVIALPQYQRAVEKARLSEAIINVRHLYNALEVYRLANGSYPTVQTLGTQDPSSFGELLGVDIAPLKSYFLISYYPGMYVGYVVNGMNDKGGVNISYNWSVGGGPGKAIMTCSYGGETPEHKKNLCLSICSDKEWHTWNHGEYCKI